MPVTNAVGALYAAQFEFNFKRQAVWRNVVEDHSMEVPYGSSLVINRDATDYDAAIADYVVGTDYAAPTRVDTGAATLELNQRKSIPVYIDDTESAQVRPSLIDSTTFEAGRALALQVNDYIRTQATDGLPAGQQLTQINVGANYANIQSTASQTAYADRMLDAGELADEQGWPPELRVAIVAPAIKRGLVQYAVDKGMPLVAAQTLDRAVVDAALLRLFGWNILVDAGIPKSTDAAYRMHFLTAGMGVAYAEQFTRSEVIRDPDRYGDILRRLVVYGAERTSGNKLIMCNISAS